MPKSALKRQHI